MRLHLLAAATAFTLALAGCASSAGLHPHNTVMAASALASDHSFAGVPISPAGWPATDWWKGLHDPQLNALMREALRNNPGLDVADARAQAAQAAAGLADAARKPQIDAGASISGARLPTTLLPSAAGGGHFAWAKYGYARFSWSPDLWGGKRAAWRAALGEARAAEVAARAARIELSGNVARAYAQLGYAFTQQDLARAEWQRARDARSLTRQRVTAGIDNQIQLQQGNAEVATAAQQLAVATRAIAAARSALSVLLGKGPDRGLEIARPTVLKPDQLAVPANLPMGLIGHRADLVAARWRVEAASRQIKAAKTEFMPNLSIGALAGLITMGGRNLFELPARFYQLGPSVSLPIFDGGRLRANLVGKDAAYDLAVAQYNRTLIGALNQVADELSAAQSLQQQVHAQQQARHAARLAWELARQRYKAGIGSYLQALVVRQQLLAAERGVATLQARQVDLSVQLSEALGGGFQPRAMPTAPTPSSTPAHS